MPLTRANSSSVWTSSGVALVSEEPDGDGGAAADASELEMEPRRLDDGDVVLPSSASMLYVTPFTCSMAPPGSMRPNCSTLPSAGERSAFGSGSSGREPGFSSR